MHRRTFIASPLLLVPALRLPNAAAGSDFAPVVPGYVLRFPRDHGAHPEFRTEWWYVTGWLNDRAGDALGFQVTFFRTRPELARDNPSAFTPRQIVIAHAALTDPHHGRLQHAQRVAREGFELAAAATGTTRTWIEDWSFAGESESFRALISAREFSFELVFTVQQPPLLHGIGGLSRKGLSPQAASYYYSLPQLAVHGLLTRRGRSVPVHGGAWLDHEWSSSYLEREAAGWDWIGINAADGGALMAFRMRGRDGNTRWAGATYRSRAGAVRVFRPEEIRFTPRRTWRSPRTGTSYPVAMEVKAGEFEIQVEPLIDDQENDARRSSGTIYWEGAVRATRSGRPFGQGYLELTGYWRALRL